ncbi:5'-nucleotidase/2',3'-cyclic phosphodiesterase [Paramagnetospirillum caucaseum]|uniref:5'-nucleotidase/2',3'-cyclic phosphodiesterase n=2 Tax=Paramagnetospirillum caucaseum TaxID=1244869 RepID=M3A817_9PROT|nr:5'-nucleotidase/2',3'-cyclic phosphodiesterase [Paramagnetospirillum caucaseum]
MIVAVLAMLLGAGQAMAEQVRLTFLHVNDIYEYRPVEGRGGLAELMTVLERERGRNPNPVFTFGGDLLSPSLASNLTKGAHMVEFFNALAPLAAVPGNHEFDFGTANFIAQIKASAFPWVGSNIEGVQGVKPSLLVDVGGVKVGFLGVLTRQTSRMSTAEGASFTDEHATAEATVRQLRAAGAELVVALTHLDLDDDRKLANAVKGIDLMLGGHDHDPVSILENGPLVLKAGHDAHWVGVADLLVDRPDPGRTGPTTVRTEGWRFLPVANESPSPALAAAVAKTDSLLGEALDQPIATLAAAMDSRTTTVRGEEAALGNLVADALRAHFAADVALINGGGLRGNRQYPAGTNLTRRDLLSEMPFGNTVMLLEVSGAQLRSVLEYTLSAVEAKAGRFPQVSGLSLTYDPARPAGSRIVKALAGGRPLDPKHLYRLATTDYLAGGGDGYQALKQGKVLVNAEAAPLLVNVVVDYVAAKGSVAPKVEGRVVAVR